MKLKIIFDKESLSEDCASGWGISYLVNHKVLFDAAEKGEYLLKNLEALKVDIWQIEKAVISHNRWNHRAGIWDLLKANSKIEVLAGKDFLTEFKDRLLKYNFRLIQSQEEIAKNIYTTGCLLSQDKGSTIEEQALVLESPKGVSLVCGCAHPGILEFVKKVKMQFPAKRFYAVLGGLHLMNEEKRTIDYIAGQIKNSGVQNIGPGHCSGFEAVTVFKKLYPKNFLEVKAGQEFEL